MSNDLEKKLQSYERLAQQVTAAQASSDQLAMANQILASLPPPSAMEQARQTLSLKNRYPGLFQLGQIQTALESGAFKQWHGIEQSLQQMCEPFLSARQLINDHEASIRALMGTPFVDLMNVSRYTMENNLSSGLLKSNLIPALTESHELAVRALDTIPPVVEKLTSMGQVLVDTTWMHKDASWIVETSKLIEISTEGIAASKLTELLSMEQQTSKMLADLGRSNLTSIAAQIASIGEACSHISDQWKEVIAPPSIINDLGNLAIRQHEEIQKVGTISEWRLGILDAASRFVDRQVTWANDLVAGLQDEVEVTENVDDFEAENYVDVRSPVALIPQHIGYTNRRNITRSPEEGLEKSSIVEITEKGKRIIENAVAINQLCADIGHDDMFKYTGRFVINATKISGTMCSSEESLGIIIDCLYMVFYENLERMKKIVTDKAVRSEAVYQCIFRVKSIRTDLRHDYEHGPESQIKKKRKDIMDCYRHYTNQPLLRTQGDFIMLQKRMYDEFIALEEHLIGLLYEIPVAT